MKGKEKKDILSVLENQLPSFSKGQRVIARYILENYDKAAFMTAARLGAAVGVSESTVVRFAAELGYRGYPGMKKALQEVVRTRLTSVERIEQAETTMSTQDVLKDVLRADIHNLQDTLDMIDQESFNRAHPRGKARLYRRHAHKHDARALPLAVSERAARGRVCDSGHGRSRGL